MRLSVVPKSVSFVEDRLQLRMYASHTLNHRSGPVEIFGFALAPVSWRRGSDVAQITDFVGELDQFGLFRSMARMFDLKLFANGLVEFLSSVTSRTTSVMLGPKAAVSSSAVVFVFLFNGRGAGRHTKQPDRSPHPHWPEH